MKKYLYMFCFFLITSSTFSQNDPTTNPSSKERIYVHLNTTFLLTGETLLFKIYCMNMESQKLSGLSKVAYVELIDKKGNIASKKKLRLEHGVGYGDFFIPTTIASGNYKLIAYTKWMLDGAVFFENDLFIVNLFSKNEFKSTKDSDEPASALTKTNESDRTSQYILLETTGNSYKKREKVELNIKALMGKKSFGNFSISVKRRLPINSPSLKESKSYLDNYQLKNTKNKDVFSLPEFRGELISGIVKEKVSGRPAVSKNIALSIPGKESVFKIATANEKGRFFFNINEYYKDTNAFLKVIDDDSNQYVIEINENSSIDYSLFQFGSYKVAEEEKAFLLEESVYNQIENSYISVKQDDIIQRKSLSPFYGKLAKEYLLDDYKRFSTLKETFVEVIESAWISNKDGNYSFEAKIDASIVKYRLPTLLLLDGVLIDNHNDVVDYEANKIEKISVLLGRYKYGPIMFDGVISIQTKKGDYKDKSNNNYQYELFKYSSKIKYFFTDYSKVNNYERIPDFRSQLFWEPNINFNLNTMPLVFYASDVPGEYCVSLQGFTNDGAPISIIKTIIVK